MTNWTFGPYRIESLLGRGGMGEVYRAFDTEHDRFVALKLLAPHLTDDASYRARFKRECHLAARLREPHVIPIHSFGEVDGRLFLDMRLVEGRDLGSAIAQGPIPAAKAVDVISQIARALDAAHDDGLIHRDVKPSNVLMAEVGTEVDPNFVFVYLVDFGVARGIGENDKSVALTQTGSAVGTFDYMPPERFLGQEADRRTDVYSLACLLYECLTARRPFLGTDLPSLMYAHINNAPPPASTLVAGLPAGLDEVIGRGMAKDPDARYFRAGEFAAAARSALAGANSASSAAPPTVLASGPGPAGAPGSTPPPPSWPTPASTPFPPPAEPPAQRSPQSPPPLVAPVNMAPTAAAWPVPPAPNTPLPPWAGGAPYSAPVPPPAGPNAKRTRLLVTIAAGVVVAVLAVVIVVALNSSGKPKASPPPVTTPTGQQKEIPPTQASSPTASPTLSSVSRFTAAQARLGDSLPSSYTLDDCVGETVPSVLSAAAAISCGPSSANPGPTSASFFAYPDVATLRADFIKLVNAQSVAQTSQQCPAIGYRGYHYTDAPDVTVGSMASFIEHDQTASSGSAIIAWTIEPDMVLSIIYNSGGASTLGNMCTWWDNN